MAFIFGSPGNDTLVGTSRDDVILGSSGDDVLRGLDGIDFLDAGDGNDRLFGDNGRDIMLGGSGDDRLEGGNGNDFLDGGGGLDRMFGGNGNDTIAFRSGSSRIADGGNGIDTVQLYSDEDFDLRGKATNVERIDQGFSHAEVNLDAQFFLTTDTNTIVIDLGDGTQDQVAIHYDSDVLDFDFVAGQIKFGTPGDLDSTLVLDDVEQLRLYDFNDPTGNHIFDHWIV